ncbi:hypothetical protein GX51_02937 [Blastomyces parvus]|uniref:Uncharacterized protein n=1 Tax=Blastomyces parvus TaxID=2060905 RepID=A0A2B7X9H6_9EURO|nr:hypothetical protein GX51_02937 [Blastomyces parvus]
MTADSPPLARLDTDTLLLLAHTHDINNGTAVVLKHTSISQRVLRFHPLANGERLFCVYPLIYTIPFDLICCAPDKLALILHPARPRTIRSIHINSSPLQKYIKKISQNLLGMKLHPSAQRSGGGLAANLSLITIYLLLAIVTLATALPVAQQSDSINTVQLPKARDQRSLPGSLATAPEGAVGHPPSPAYGSEGYNTESMPTKKPVYFTLLVIAVFVCVLIVLFERL